MKQKGIRCLTSKLVLDQIAASTATVDGEVKMLVDPDELWYLNSKAALSTSGLPTPHTEMLEVEGYCPAAADCCRYGYPC